MNKRTQPRFLCSELLKMERRHVARRPQITTVNLEDISLSGACVTTDMPLQKGESIVLRYADGDLPGVVRYCLYRDSEYFLGICFAHGCEWPKDFYRPEHLLDLPEFES